MGPRRVVLLLALAGTAALCGLGIWQVSRLQDQRKALAEAQESLVLEPAGNAEALAWGEEPPGGIRRVRLEGAFAQGTYRIPAFHGARPGFRVVGVFLPHAWPHSVMVDRGWVPQGHDPDTLPRESILEGLALEGAAGPEANAGGGVWRAMAPEAMGVELGEPVAGWFVVAGEMREPEEGAGVPVTGWVLPVRRTPHGTYALTWFSLAALTLAYGVAAWRGWIRPLG